MKYVTVRVVNSSGSPQHHVRVGIYIGQSIDPGMVPDQYTDSNGEARFNLDISEYAQIAVYVNGSEKVRQGSVRSEYLVTI